MPVMPIIAAGNPRNLANPSLLTAVVIPMIIKAMRQILMAQNQAFS